MPHAVSLAINSIFIKARANGFNICFNISSILLNAIERLLNDVERRDGKTVSTFDSTKLCEWPGSQFQALDLRAKLKHMAGHILKSHDGSRKYFQQCPYNISRF